MKMIDERSERSFWALMIGIVVAVILGMAQACVQVGDDVNAPSATAILNQGASPSPSSGPGGSCAFNPESYIQLGGPSEMRVGEVKNLSATPFLRPGVPSPKSCDDARNVVWQALGPCSIEGSGYNPDLRASAAGECKVSMQADSLTSNSVIVRVLP